METLETKTSCLIGCLSLIVVLIFVAGISALMGGATMLVWNATIGVSGGPQLSFFVAWGVWFVLSSLVSRIGISACNNIGKQE